MGANDKKEATFHGSKGRGLPPGETEATFAAGKKSVIEKLTAPPETLREHAEREGWHVDRMYRQVVTSGDSVWWEELKLSRIVEEPKEFLAEWKQK